MRKLLVLIIGCVFYSLPSMSQTSTVEGVISDTVNNKKLYRTTISLLRRTDSVLSTFARSATDGRFQLKNIDPGKYILLVSHPGFADYSDTINLQASANLQLGEVFLTPKSKLLEEIIIKKTIPAIRMKGDTMVFKADSFAIKGGASVEDLLKVMPGFQVDKNGQITAQGERVQKVLVDGEEFFSDDPTIATKNLLANMVEDVEVFNKKSDQAEFTGIDDGEKNKTINLKLKEEKKNGYFGKVESGSDFRQYWNNNVMLNYFKGKKKISAFGIMSNTGKTGLSWQENANYGGMGGSNMETGMSDDGGMYIMINNSDEMSSPNFYGEGLPRSWSGGLHFSNKWDGDRKHINGNYRFNKLNNEALVNTRTQYILPDTLYYQNQQNNTVSSRMRHQLESIYEVNLDSSSSIKITARGSVGKTLNNNETITESRNEENLLVNNSNRINTSSGDNQAFNSTLLYRKKFKEQGHTFSLNIRQDYSQQNTDGFLIADNRFYYSNGDMSQELIDQKKINDNKTINLSARAAYTRPISKRSYLEFNYSIGNNRRSSNRQTLEKSTPSSSKYEEIVELLSNNLDYNTWTNSGGINYRYAKPKKFSFSFGGNVSQNNLLQKDMIRDTTIRYNFLNFFPQARVQFNMKKNKNLNINYNGSTQQPTIEQLQPIVDNNDPLNIYTGNPNLKLALNHYINAHFGGYDFLSESGFFSYVSLNLVQNAFSTRDEVDSLGRRIFQTVNVNGVYNLNSYFDYNFKIKKTGLSASAGFDIGIGRNVNFVNGIENKVNNGRIGVNAALRYFKEKVGSFSTRSSFNQNFSKSSIRTDIKTNFWIQSHDVDVTAFLPWKFELSAEVSFNFRQKTSVFDTDNNAILFNAWIDKKILKNDAARIRLYAFDILNQNIGFRRNITTNYISEKTYNTFRRYLMLSLIWNFNKNGKPQGF